MSSITFDVSNSKYDKKLLLKFPYNEAISEKIKSLPWDRVHYGYHNPDDDESCLYGYVDTGCWYIDHDREAMRLLEDALDIAIPSEHWPGKKHPDTADGPSTTDAVALTVPAGTAEFIVSPSTDRVTSLLDTAFSYDKPDAKYSDAYQNGHWDGKIHLFDTDAGRGPVGFLNQAEELLTQEGYDVTVTWEEKTKGELVKTKWKFPHTMRGYQREAVQSTIQNHGGIISLPTGTGKTVTALRIIYELNRKSIVLVHTRELLYQWAEQVEEILGVEPGIIGDGNWSEGDVTVAIMQTLMSRGTADLDNEYGITVFDECHRTSAADTMHEIGMQLDSYYRIGLSATPWRRVDGEEMKIEGAIKETAHEVTAKDMIQAGYLANPVFDIIDPSDYGVPNRSSRDAKYPKAYRECIELDPARLRAVAVAAKELADDGHKVLVNVNRIIQGELIAWMLNPAIDIGTAHERIEPDDEHRKRLFNEAIDRLEPLATTNAMMVSADASDTKRETVLSEFEDGDRNIVVSTLLKEGVDIPDISAIVLAHGQKSDLETIQTIGRALRPTGDYARIVDIADSGRFFRKAFRERCETMETYYDLDTELSKETAPVPAVPTDELEIEPLSADPNQTVLTDL